MNVGALTEYPEKNKIVSDMIEKTRRFMTILFTFENDCAII
jgi:hypothetical protein